MLPTKTLFSNLPSNEKVHIYPPPSNWKIKIYAAENNYEFTWLIIDAYKAIKNSDNKSRITSESKGLTVLWSILGLRPSSLLLPPVRSFLFSSLFSRS